jgi:integrase
MGHESDGENTVKITKRVVDGLKIGERITDDEIPGFRARRLPSGKTTFTFRHGSGSGRSETGLGLYGGVTVDQARAHAAKLYAGFRNGENPIAEQRSVAERSTNTLDRLLDERLAWMAKQGKRSTDEVKRMFARHVRPKLGSKVLTDLCVQDTTRLLDKIAAETPQAARGVHANLNAALVWGRGRYDGLDRIIMPKKKSIAAPSKRSRVLSREEIKILWQALDLMDDGESVYPALVRTLLLTACRADEVASMHAREITGDKWTIPGSRYKTGRDHVVPMIAEIAGVLPKKTVGYIFASAGFDAPFSGFSKAKARLDQTITELRRGKPIEPWVLHDLRRTARSHMEDAGVLPHIAERLLGHVQGGIEGVYNHKDYTVEKTDALNKWAAYVDGCVHPSPAKVVPLSAAKRRNVGG